jgi:peptidoglycan/LPS O-acetylase OafA/YrhL
MTRLPGLDLLRAGAIVWVMLYHLESYGIEMPGLVRHGWMGVDLFFVLSGYLIGGQLLRPCARGERLRWGEFMLRRAFRVLPAYCTVLALYFAVPAIRESDGVAPAWQFLTFTTNLFPDYFHNRAFSHAWSLCVEEHFYLLLPPAVWLLTRASSGRNAAAAAGVLLIGGVLLRGWLWQHEVGPYAQVHGGPHDFNLRWVEQIYNPTYARLDGLIAGVTLAAVEVFRPALWQRAMGRWPLLLPSGLAGVFACTRVEPTGLAGTMLLFPLLAASLALLVAGAINLGSRTRRRSLPGAKQVSLVSFSLYLTHKQVYAFIHAQLGPFLERSDLFAFISYNAAALAVAGLLYMLVERPALMLRDRLLAPSTGHTPAPGMATSTSH